MSSNLLDEAMGLPNIAGGHVILIEDCVETSGAFVLQHLIKRGLSPQGPRVILLAFSQPFFHYDRVLRKLGCNLSAYKESGRLCFFDMLKMEFQGEQKGEEAIEFGLMNLYKRIHVAVTSSESCGNGTVIFVDDLSLLETAARGSIHSVLDFLQYCTSLTSEQGCTVVILNHEDIYTSADAPRLLQNLYYYSDIVLKVEPLATGLAADVHGQLAVVNKSTGPSGRKTCKFHFRVKENGAEFFYPGTHS